MAAVPLPSRPRPSTPQRAPSTSEPPSFAESATRIKQAKPEHEGTEADIQASLQAAFAELDQLEAQSCAAEPRVLAAAAPARLRALPSLPTKSRLPAHMPPLPVSEPRIAISKRRVTPPPLPRSALVPASAPIQPAHSIRVSPARRSPLIARVMLVILALLAISAVSLALWPGVNLNTLVSLKPAWFAYLGSL